MSHALVQQLAATTPREMWLIAQTSSPLAQQVGMGTAIVLTLTGMALHWNQPRHRMTMEERAKDGKITDEAAERRFRIYTRCGPAFTLVGILLLVVVLVATTG